MLQSALKSMTPASKLPSLSEKTDPSTTSGVMRLPFYKEAFVYLGLGAEEGTGSQRVPNRRW